MLTCTASTCSVFRPVDTTLEERLHPILPSSQPTKLADRLRSNQESNADALDKWNADLTYSSASSTSLSTTFSSSTVHEHTRSSDQFELQHAAVGIIDPSIERSNHFKQEETLLRSVSSHKTDEVPQRLLQAARHDLVTTSALEGAMRSIQACLKHWAPSACHPELATNSSSNKGQVCCTKLKLNGKMFVVKQIPTSFFQAYHHPSDHLQTSCEQHLQDMALVKVLNDLNFPYICKLHGFFCDDEHTYMATLPTLEGNLHAWCHSGPPPSYRRESMIGPVVLQCCSALRALHDLDVAHLNVCLENVLVDRDSDGLRIKLVDFGMAHLSRFCAPARVSKDAYQAPEVLGTENFDSFKADGFSFGVLVYTLACQEYPWRSTSRSDACPLFRFVVKHGFRAFAARRQVRRQNQGNITSVLSCSLRSLLSALLEISPSKRSCLGENCYICCDDSQNTSVWGFSWMQLHLKAGIIACV